MFPARLLRERGEERRKEEMQMHRIVFLMPTWIVGVNGTDFSWIKPGLYKKEMK